jgi:hypothetical protein
MISDPRFKNIVGGYDEETVLRHLEEVPLKEGYTRIYEDHTGRNWQDVSPEDMEASRNDPLIIDLQTAIDEEINREIARQMGIPMPNLDRILGKK